MKIIITGASGFVGSHLVPKLLEAKHQILEVTIEPEKSHKLYGDQTKQINFSVTSHEALCNIFNDFQSDVCIHLASYVTSRDDYTSLKILLQSNIQFTCTILDALKKSNLKAFINTGSFAEYCKGDRIFDPAYLYTATKTASRSFVDYYSKTYHFKDITIVPYTIYGGVDTRKKIIDLIFDSIDSKQPINLTPGEQILDFIHVDDVTDFYVKVIDNIEAIPSGMNFHLGTGVGTTIQQLAKHIERISGKKTNINWGAKDYRPRDVMYAVADVSTQYNLLDWKPKIALEGGIEKYLEQRVMDETDR